MDNNTEKKIKRNELDTLGVEEKEDTSEVGSKELQFLGGNYDLPEKTKKNKQVKTKPSGGIKRFVPIIALLIIAVFSFGVYYVVQKVFPASATDQKYDITEEKNKDIIELAPDIAGTSAERLEIKNRLDEFTFVRRLEKTYYIEGKKELPVVNSKILSALTYSGAVKAQTVV